MNRAPMTQLVDTRKSLDLTQRQVADLIGVSLRTYQRLEDGSRRGTIDVWEKLAGAFAVPLQQLRKTSETDYTQSRTR